jgi:2-keto-3-deoxy-L-rhamnonate aldolase RhmA
MATAINTAKARLKRNQLAIGIGVRLVRNVDIIKVMKAAGFDWLFLDLEHGSMSIQTACEISVAAQDSGIAPIVRVPYGELAMATRVLDGGALGVVIPMSTRPEEAKEIADRLRQPPRAATRWVAARQSRLHPDEDGRHDPAQRRQHVDHR